MPSETGRVYAGPALNTTLPLACVALPIDGTRTACESFQTNVARLGDQPALRMPHDSIVVSGASTASVCRSSRRVYMRWAFGAEMQWGSCSRTDQSSS